MIKARFFMDDDSVTALEKYFYVDSYNEANVMALSWLRGITDERSIRFGKLEKFRRIVFIRNKFGGYLVLSKV